MPFFFGAFASESWLSSAGLTPGLLPESLSPGRKTFNRTLV